MKIINLFKYIPVFLGIKQDKKLAFNLIVKLASHILPEYRFTFPEMVWWQDLKFNEYLQRFNQEAGFNTHRLWMLKQLLRLTVNVPGDTAECGVFQGCSSYAILEDNSRSVIQRWHHIFDSFEGLSSPSIKDGEHWTKGDLSAGEALVKQNLAGFDRVTLYKGWIPSKFHEVDEQKFSFVHVDVDLYQPTFDSITFFYDRLSDGGVFLCDDYGFDTCPGATIAVDEFLKSKPEKMLVLPDGGGFFIKNCTTKDN